MRSILAVSFVVLLCVGCGSSTRTSKALHRVPPCRAAITWRETFYYGREVVGLPVRGGTLGLAGVPSCTDVLGGENGASRAVYVSSLAGIDPRVAIAVTGDGHHVYVAAGRSLRLPGDVRPGS
jgi:hypothetical protein